MSDASYRSAFDKLVETVHRLRAPGGCPWDRAQTHQTLRPYLIEEAYEVLDVIDQIHSMEDLKKAETKQAFCEELGDLLMQVLIHSEIAKEAGAFDIDAVAEGLNEKLIRRHPHVFGDTTASDSDEALKNWEKQKTQEKLNRSSQSSVLDGLPKGLPALQRSERMIEKVSKVGFQWSDLQGPLQKIKEELSELETEINQQSQSKSAKRIEAELGDLFFAVCNLSYLLKVHPENALRECLTRFENRFRYVEAKLREKGKAPEHSTLEEMDKLWDEAKALEHDH